MTRAQLRRAVREVKNFHAAVDQRTHGLRLLLADTPEPVTCRGKGCAACCRGEVMATAQELLLLRPHLNPGAVERLRAMRDVDLKPSGSPHPVCPLLEADQSCGVYAQRPALCRLFLSVSDPDLCQPGPVTHRPKLVLDTPVAETLHAMPMIPLVQGLNALLDGTLRLDFAGENPADPG